MIEVANFPIGEAFDLPVEGVFAEGYAEATKDVPSRDDEYVFPKASLRPLLLWWDTREGAGRNDGLAVNGHTGCGKSTLVEQFANRLNIPVFSVICSPRTEPEDLYGSMGLVGGSTVFQKGPAVKAAEAGGILLIEEGDRLDPTVLGTLAPLMEGKPFRVPGDGRLIKPHGKFSVVMTSNTRGGHDPTGLYGGNRQQNLATMSRLQGIWVDYPSPQEEERILEKKVVSRAPANKQKAVREMSRAQIKIANKVRESFKSHKLDTTISTRILLRWSELTLKYMSIADVERPYEAALDQALLSNSPEDTQAAVHETIKAVLGTPK